MNFHSWLSTPWHCLFLESIFEQHVGGKNLKKNNNKGNSCWGQKFNKWKCNVPFGITSQGFIDSHSYSTDEDDWSDDVDTPSGRGWFNTAGLQTSVVHRSDRHPRAHHSLHHPRVLSETNQPPQGSLHQGEDASIRGPNQDGSAHILCHWPVHRKRDFNGKHHFEKEYITNKRSLFYPKLFIANSPEGPWQ